uniref:lipocalin family protein n=1 Tax=Microvirga roseola TaxID=2883126 RepID=UPI0038995D6E
MVRGPGEGFGWILSRSPDLDEEAREAAEAAMEEAGLDPTRLEETDQPPETYRPGQQ